ncbi:hypothetical protein Tco_0343542 [Tanacetum coccineum]
MWLFKNRCIEDKFLVPVTDSVSDTHPISLEKNCVSFGETRGSRKKKANCGKSKRLKIDIGRFPLLSACDSSPSTFDVLSDRSEILSDSNDDVTSSDDDDFEDIEYVEASPPDLEIVSLGEPLGYRVCANKIVSIYRALKELRVYEQMVLLLKSCGNGAHIGYNCPPKAPIISNPEPCNQTIDELPQTLPSFDPTCYSEKENSLPYASKPNFVDNSPNVFDPPPQPSMYSCEFCGNDARYGHYCTPQVPFIYPEPCYNQDFKFPQDFHEFQQQYLCCENCEGPHETFQCQPMNEDYYEQDSCYDPNSFGFDQFQPPQYTVNHPIFNAQNSLFNAQNEFLNSQNKLMEQMTSICDMVGQIMQKKEEEKRIAEEQAAKDRYWKIPICYDDDEEYTIAITPDLPTKEPEYSLIMGDEHLSTIPEKESDELIKSSVENLVPISSESEVISDDTCDVPVCEDPSTFDVLSDRSEILSDSNDDVTSSDDDDFEDIEYVEASPPNLEIVSLGEVNDIDQEKEEFDLENILQIQDVILREKLLNINRLIANIESLDDNSTPNRVLKSPSLFPIPVVDKETRSGSTTTHANNSLREYDSFLFEIEPDQGELANIVIEEVDTFLAPENSILLGIESNFDLRGGEINVSQNVEDDDSFTFVIRTFLLFLTYPADSSLLFSSGSEDTIFDPGISIFHFSSLKPVAYENLMVIFSILLFMP